MTKERNERDFVDIKLKIRGMANMKYFKGTAATILGQQHTLQTPIGLGPIPWLKRFHFDGELAAAKAAKELGIVYTLDVRSSYPFEMILKESAGGLKLIQLSPELPAEQTQALLKAALGNKDVIGFVMDFGLD